MPRQIRFTVDVSITYEGSLTDSRQHFVSGVSTYEETYAPSYCVSVQSSVEELTKFVRDQIFAGVDRS